MYEEHKIRPLIQWPPEWIPGKPVPPRRHSRYKKARMKTIRCVHPKLKKIPKQNKLWHKLIEDTKEWHMLNDTIIPSVLLALERTCRLERIFQATKKNDGIFSFADSFVHFLLNENQSDVMHDITPRSVPEIARALDIESLRYPEIPKYKIMSKNKAAKIIQKNVRGWLVRKQPEISEMREFWKIIREDKFKEVIRTDTTLTFNKNEPKISPTDENFEKLFGEVVEEGSEPEMQEKKQYDWDEHEPKPCVASPCENFGLTDNILDTLTKPELEEAIRIYSLHPELQPSALKTFLSRIKVKKDKLIEGKNGIMLRNSIKNPRNQGSIGNLLKDVKLNSVEK